MKLSIHLVVWNGAKYIPYLFESLRRQTSRDWSLLAIDNNSTDNTVEALKKELTDFPAPFELIENKENKGFAGGHNQAFRATDSEYFLLLNQDMYLAPDCLAKMVRFLDERPDASAVSPRLMKWNFVNIADDADAPVPQINADNLQKSFSNQIDALGLKIFRNRRVIEQFTGQEWDSIVIASPDLVGTKQSHGHPVIPAKAGICCTGNHEITSVVPTKSGLPRDDIEVFGVSGAFPMYRRAMIQEVLFSDGNFFDESYHSYKEDVDLAYRLAARGFKSYVLLDTVAYHDRAGAGPKELDDQSAAANKRKQSAWVKYHSYKNHLMTLYKNEYWQNFILDLPWILWYELKKFGYFLLFDRQVLAGLKEIWDKRADLAEKRMRIKELKTVSWKEIRRWWMKSVNMSREKKI